MWERGERERVIKEEQDKTWIKEQEKTINNKSSFNDTISNFEKIFTVSERDKFENRDLKRTNTIDKFDEIFDSMDISSHKSSADSSKQSIEEKDEDPTEDDDENDETIKSKENSIIEAVKVLEDRPNYFAEEVFKEFDTHKFKDAEVVKDETKLDSSEDDSVTEEIEDTAVCEEIDQLESISEEIRSEEQLFEDADDFANSILVVEPFEASESDIVDPVESSEYATVEAAEGSESEDSGQERDIENHRTSSIRHKESEDSAQEKDAENLSARRFSSGSPVTMMAR